MRNGLGDLLQSHLANRGLPPQHSTERFLIRLGQITPLVRLAVSVINCFIIACLSLIVIRFSTAASCSSGSTSAIGRLYPRSPIAARRLLNSSSPIASGGKSMRSRFITLTNARRDFLITPHFNLSPTSQWIGGGPSAQVRRILQTNCVSSPKQVGICSRVQAFECSSLRWRPLKYATPSPCLSKHGVLCGGVLVCLRPNASTVGF